MAHMNELSHREFLGKAPELIRLINNGSMSQAVCVAAELGIADLLALGPKSADALARATGSHAPSLHRLMHALASLELCIECDDGCFALTQMGLLLRTDAPNSLRSWTILCGKYVWPVPGDLLRSVQTGEANRERAGGADRFGPLETDKKAAAVFNGAMAELSRLVASEVLHSYHFQGMRRIVDVGGGYGALLAAVLQAHPQLSGVLLDLPHAIEGAKAHMAGAGTADRCEFVAGSFFDPIPGGGDAYLLKAVLHDWNDEEAVAILRNCRRAVAPEGKLLVIERIMPERFEACPLHHAIARVDLTMLVEFGGRERTEAEFHSLLESAGFALAKVTATSLEYSLLEGIPY
jgi:SAM-dependent methyltransferase